jgi:23S rRNA (pseudouridine1915-N3)-methyltransferase
VKLTIVAVGNKMPDWVETAFADYAKRMPPHMRVELKEIKAEKREGGKTAEQIMQAEKTRIEVALPDGAMLIAMDERGAQISSLQLADWMREWQGGGRDVALIIGGADGLHESLRQRAYKTLALSHLTLPHGLARVLLAEQLYRAYSITQNHPYHRE